MGQACGEAGSSVPVPRHVCTIAFCLPLWPRWGAQGLAILMVKWPKRRGLSWPWLPQRGGQWVAVGLSYVAFFMLRHGPSVSTLLRVFIVNECGILSNAFSDMSRS